HRAGSRFDATRRDPREAFFRFFRENANGPTSAHDSYVGEKNVGCASERGCKVAYTAVGLNMGRGAARFGSSRRTAGVIELGPSVTAAESMADWMSQKECAVSWPGR